MIQSFSDNQHQNAAMLQKNPSVVPEVDCKFGLFQYSHIVSFIWAKETVSCEMCVIECVLCILLQWIFEHFSENRFAVIIYVIQKLKEKKTQKFKNSIMF